MVALLRRQLTAEPERAKAIIGNLIKRAEADDPKALNAIAEIIDRIDGKAVQTIQADVEQSIQIVSPDFEAESHTADAEAEAVINRLRGKPSHTNGNGSGNGTH